MARLIVCCDGTWNTPEQEDNGVPAPTNVFKLYGALANKDNADDVQKKYYRKGVGTSGGFLAKLTGGAFGAGLSDDIKSAYKWLCDTYEDGDSIYLFGFSRGAYSVRSLGGLIGKCGLLRFSDQITETEKWHRVTKGFAAYRKGPPGDPWDTSFERDASVQIAFVGVWDTVGALGIPDEFRYLFFGRFMRHRFHNTVLGDTVSVARHAVAIDERRQAFSPTLWNADPAIRDVKEIWFPGVHGDVGGSYAAHGLSDSALDWMITEASATGLAFKEKMRLQIKPNQMDALHDSVKSAFSKMRTRPRNVPAILGDGRDLHRSAIARQDNPPLAQPVYWPTHLLPDGESCKADIFASERWNATGVYLEKGVEYRLSAAGEWCDGSITCSPDGPSGDFQLGQIIYGFSAISDWWQKKRRARRENAAAIIWGARRENDMPWCSLVGVIANGSGVSLDSKELIPHQTFLIGATRTEFVPRKSGYLYCFANDIWGSYRKNSGSVRLKVTRAQLAERR